MKKRTDKSRKPVVNSERYELAPFLHKLKKGQRHIIRKTNGFQEKAPERN
jgi:hypothetical protein